MPWCPKCKNEYIEGITVCADCGAGLVESLQDCAGSTKPVTEESLIEESLTGESLTVENLTVEEASVRQTRDTTWHSAYVNSAQKAEENKSSAYILLIGGVFGLTVSILVLTGVIPLYQNAAMAKYLVCGVMGALFLLFLIFGIVSMKNFKVLSVKAESENSLVAEMTKWCGENLSAGRIDEDLFGMEEISEEQKYFRRVEKMKLLLQENFLNLEDAFLDDFVDGYYQNLFENGRI